MAAALLAPARSAPGHRLKAGDCWWRQETFLYALRMNSGGRLGLLLVRCGALAPVLPIQNLITVASLLCCVWRKILSLQHTKSFMRQLPHSASWPAKTRQNPRAKDSHTQPLQPHKANLNDDSPGRVVGGLDSLLALCLCGRVFPTPPPGPVCCPLAHCWFGGKVQRRFAVTQHRQLRPLPVTTCTQHPGTHHTTKPHNTLRRTRPPSGAARWRASPACAVPPAAAAGRHSQAAPFHPA